MKTEMEVEMHSNSFRKVVAIYCFHLSKRFINYIIKRSLVTCTIFQRPIEYTWSILLRCLRPNLAWLSMVWEMHLASAHGSLNYKAWCSMLPARMWKTQPNPPHPVRDSSPYMIYKDICMNIRLGGHGWLHICRTDNLGNGVFEIWYGVRGSGVFIRIRLVAAVWLRQFSAQIITKFSDF